MQVGRAVLGPGYQPSTAAAGSPFPFQPSDGPAETRPAPPTTASGVRPPAPITTAPAWEIKARAYELAMSSLRGAGLIEHVEILDRASIIYDWLIGTTPKPSRDRHAVVD